MESEGTSFLEEVAGVTSWREDSRVDRSHQALSLGQKGLFLPLQPLLDTRKGAHTHTHTQINVPPQSRFQGSWMLQE